MTKKIFRSIFLVALAVLLCCLVLIMGVLYDYFTGLQLSQLRTQTALAARGVEENGATYFSSLSAPGVRLTWIAADGAVLYDTESDPAAMENHADREEFIEAEATGAGESSRVSATLSERTVYVARALPDGTVLRASATHYTIPTLLMGILVPLIIVIMAAAGLAALLAGRVAKRIVGPLCAVDLEHPLENDEYEELTPLLRRVEQQQRRITDQMEELRRRREEFGAVTENMSEGLILLDAQGRVLSMNSAAVRIAGARAGEGADILTVDRSTALRELLSSPEGGETVVERQGREYQLRLTPVLSDGERRGSVVLAFDVTEKLGAEQARREFTANVSHELKTPLQSIMGSAELLSSGLVKAEDAARFLTRIHTEAEHLVTLIDDIIGLSRLDEGGDYPTESVELRALCSSVAEELRPAAEKKGISITVSGGEASVTGAAPLLREIAFNLCDNAVKYGREGGRADMSVATGDGAVTLIVQDNGIGIAPEEQARVFERFYRVDKSRSRAIGGTGLGLSIVKHAAAWHHAEVTLRSLPGKGTTVTVRFPA